MIRPATLADIPNLIAMGKTFTDKAGFADHVGYDEESVAALLEGLIAGAGICLVGDQCMAAALIYPHPYNQAHLAAQELFWWSEGREGMLLFAALEEAVRKRGAHSLTMITIQAIEPEKMGRLYRKRGFSPVEHHYMKVF